MSLPYKYDCEGELEAADKQSGKSKCDAYLLKQPDCFNFSSRNNIDVIYIIKINYIIINYYILYWNYKVKYIKLNYGRTKNT